MLKEVKRHIQIYSLFLKNSIITQMEYRFNFFMALLVETGWLFAKILYIIVVFNTGVVVKGLTPHAILMFIGTYVFLTGIYWSFFAINFAQIPEHIRTGTFDLYMTKPVSLMFFLTMRKVDIGMPIPDILGGIVMIVLGWYGTGMPASLVNILGFVVFLISGVVISYALFLIPQLMSFFMVKTSAINELSYALWDFNNMPMAIYNKWIQRIGTFILPIFLISNYSTLFVMGKLGFLHIIWGLIAPVILMAVLRLLWSYSIKNYTSANG